jgi:MFS family permease
MEGAPVSLPAYWRLLRDNRNFRKLWLAQIISEIGDWFYTVALYALLYDLTGSARSLSTALMFQVLPQFFFGPIAGAINDRLSRRAVMIFSDCARALIVLLMVFFRTREMLPFLYFLLLCETVGWALFEPARSAIIPNITSGDTETVTANGLSSTTWAFNFFFGAAVGGVAAAAFGRETVFLINSASFLVSALLVRSMVFREPHLEGQPPFHWRDLFDFKPVVAGLRYVRDHAEIRPVIFLKAGVALMGTNWVILPILGERTFPLQVFGIDSHKAGMLGMSALLGARGLGALIGPLTGGSWAGKDVARMRLGVALGFMLILAGYTSLGFANTIWLAVPAVALAHSGGSMVWVFSSSMLHFMTEDKFRGRVFSADYMFMTLTLSITSMIAGTAIDSGVSLQAVCIGTGLAALLPLSLWSWAGFKKRAAVQP